MWEGLERGTYLDRESVERMEDLERQKNIVGSLNLGKDSRIARPVFSKGGEFGELPVSFQC
jgi:hypothetical protein